MPSPGLCHVAAGAALPTVHPGFLGSPGGFDGVPVCSSPRGGGGRRAQGAQNGLGTPGSGYAPTSGPSSGGRAPAPPPDPSPPQPAAVQAAAPYHLDGVSSVGGSDLAILSRTRMGLSSWCGGSIWAISISVMPRDQMSAL